MIYRANVVCKMELCWPWKLFSFFFFFLGCYAAFELGKIIIIMSGLYPMNSTCFVTLSFIRSLHMECALQNRPKITAFLWLCQYVNLLFYFFLIFFQYINFHCKACTIIIDSSHLPSEHMHVQFSFFSFFSFFFLMCNSTFISFWMCSVETRNLNNEWMNEWMCIVYLLMALFFCFFEKEKGTDKKPQKSWNQRVTKLNHFFIKRKPLEYLHLSFFFFYPKRVSNLWLQIQTLLSFKGGLESFKLIAKEGLESFNLNYHTIDSNGISN